MRFTIPIFFVGLLLIAALSGCVGGGTGKVVQPQITNTVSNPEPRLMGARLPQNQPPFSGFLLSSEEVKSRLTGTDEFSSPNAKETYNRITK